MNQTNPRASAARFALAFAFTFALAGCGYKGDLVAPDHRDEKAGQVEPDPVEPAQDPPG